MAVRRRESEEWFESYCEAHGITVLAHEPDLSEVGVTSRPDYLVAKDGVEVLCEVKQFEETEFDRLRARLRPFTTSSAMRLKPVRGAVREAARQLKPLDGSKWPLVVILANPAGFSIPLRPERLIEALYGDFVVTFEVGPSGGAVTEPRFGAGPNGRLRNNHPYVTAVAALHRGDLEAPAKPTGVLTTEELMARYEERAALAARVPEDSVPAGTFYRLDTVRNWSATASPLPEWFSTGERDTLWTFDETSASYVKIEPTHR